MANPPLPSWPFSFAPQYQPVPFVLRARNERFGRRDSDDGEVGRVQDEALRVRLRCGGSPGRATIRVEAAPGNAAVVLTLPWGFLAWRHGLEASVAAHTSFLAVFAASYSILP